jgi:hypothetical protein
MKELFSIKDKDSGSLQELPAFWEEVLPKVLSKRGQK